jgi:DNA-binding beta-propeller fold protein YncE
MTFRLARSTKLMSFGIVLSLGWFLFESCDCDETKEDKFPGSWVACIDNKPTLMYYIDDSPEKNDLNSFDPSQYDCTNPNSPPRAKSSHPVYPPGPRGGPVPDTIQGHATAAATAYLPQRWRQLPFLPQMKLPAPAACDPSWPDVLQTNENRSEITRFSVCPFQIKTVIPIPGNTNTLQVAVTPDGSTAIVTSFDSRVNFIDLSSNTVKQTVLLDGSLNPDGIDISPDGTRAYITSFNNNSPSPVVLVMDLTQASKPIVAQIPTVQYPQGATLTPDGSQLWVTAPLTFDMAVIDTLTNTNVINLAIPNTTGVAFNSTGTRVFITSGSGQAAGQQGKVYVVDTGTFQTVQTYTVGASPSDIEMAYGDQWLVVNNNADGSISVIDLLQNAVKTTKVGTNVWGIAFVH